jgi:hypothetical protein
MGGDWWINLFLTATTRLSMDVCLLSDNGGLPFVMVDFVFADQTFLL